MFDLLAQATQPNDTVVVFKNMSMTEIGVYAGVVGAVILGGIVLVGKLARALIGEWFGVKKYIRDQQELAQATSELIVINKGNKATGDVSLSTERKVALIANGTGDGGLHGLPR